ncbi:hypothetical protein KCU62_g217, partial [Aureobasidium sp. EXF-3399]
MSTSPPLSLSSSPKSKPMPSSSPPYVSVSLILADSGSSPYAFKLRASSALYLRMTSPFSSCLPRMCPSLFSPSKHCASSLPLPSILTTWAYSALLGQSRVLSRFSLSPVSGRFFLSVCGAHTFPLFLGMANVSLEYLERV